MKVNLRDTILLVCVLFIVVNLIYNAFGPEDKLFEACENVGGRLVLELTTNTQVCVLGEWE